MSMCGIQKQTVSFIVLILVILQYAMLRRKKPIIKMIDILLINFLQSECFLNWTPLLVNDQSLQLGYKLLTFQ